MIYKEAIEKLTSVLLSVRFHNLKNKQHKSMVETRQEEGVGQDSPQQENQAVDQVYQNADYGNEDE